MRCITKVSVLEAFDPLLLSDEEELPLETGGKSDGIFFVRAHIYKQSSFQVKNIHDVLFCCLSNNISFLTFEGELPESKKESIYYSSNISEGSFYESYDPFEYMGAKAQQQKEGGEDQQDAHLTLQTEDLNVSDG